MIVGLLVALSAVGLAIVWRGNDGPERPHGSSFPPRSTAREAPSAAAPTIMRVEPRQASEFAVMSSSPEGLAQPLRELVGKPVLGMNWDLAQRLQVRLPGNF